MQSRRSALFLAQVEKRKVVCALKNSFDRFNNFSADDIIASLLVFRNQIRLQSMFLLARSSNSIQFTFLHEKREANKWMLFK